MKTHLHQGLLLLCFGVLLGCGQQEQKDPEPMRSFTASNTEQPLNDTAAITVDETAMVFVCKSSGAKKYHPDGNCHGLNRCKREIVEMSVRDAENRGLGLCGYEK